MPTIGVAIPVPEPFGRLLREKRALFGDPLAKTVPSHVTLIPPTVVPESELDAVCGALERASVTLPSFPMQLQGTGTFRPVSPVVFVAVSQGIAHTETLARCVRGAVQADEPEFPFHPHVTVAHNLDDASLDRAYEELRTFECQFAVAEFAIYHHHERSGWAPRRTFALGPNA